MNKFKHVGTRTFERISDEKGKLVAYVGGETPRDMHQRACLFVAAPKLVDTLRAAVNDVALAAETAKHEGRKHVYQELRNHIDIYNRVLAEAEGKLS